MKKPRFSIKRDGAALVKRVYGLMTEYDIATPTIDNWDVISSHLNIIWDRSDRTEAWRKRWYKARKMVAEADARRGEQEKLDLDKKDEPIPYTVTTGSTEEEEVCCNTYFFSDCNGHRVMCRGESSWTGSTIREPSEVWCSYHQVMQKRLYDYIRGGTFEITQRPY
jgi:hypothetical protein